MALDSPINLHNQVKLGSTLTDRPLQDPVEAMKHLSAGLEPAPKPLPAPGLDQVDPYGGTVAVDTSGTRTTLYKDGALRVERTDHSGFTLTPKNDGSFAKHSWAPAAKHWWLPNGNKDEVLSGATVIAQKRDWLLPDSLEQIKDQGELKTFRFNLQRFEDRAQKDNLSAAQIAQTYQQVDMLLSAQNNQNTSREQRIALAEQIINQAADPSQVRQGNNNTCGPTSIESAAYLRHPEMAARVVTDTAITGKYVAFDGTVVQTDPAPQTESRTEGGAKVERNPGPDQRSYASQIFQVAALNAIMQKNKAFPGRSYYVDAEGEHAKVRLFKRDGQILERQYPFVGTDSSSLAYVYQAITGDGSLKAISHDNHLARTVSGPHPVVRSESDLNLVLATAKMPAVILLNADNAPLDQPAPDGKGHFLDGNLRGHFVIVNSYTPGLSPRVEIRNPQGEGFPYGRGGQMSVHDLHLASLPRKEAISTLEQDVQSERKGRRPQPVHELELLRLKLEDGVVSHIDGERELKRITSGMTTMEKTRMGERRLIDVIAEISNISGKSLLAMGVNP